MAGESPEVEDGIKVSETNVLAVTWPQVSKETPIGEETSEEDKLDIYYALDFETAENKNSDPNVPLEITLQEIMESQRSG